MLGDTPIVFGRFVEVKGFRRSVLTRRVTVFTPRITEQYEKRDMR
jgi:hypothetical protein